MACAAPPREPHARLARALILLLLASIALYCLARAAILRIEYYDAFGYLGNAKLLAGGHGVAYAPTRFPFVVLVQVPAMLVVKAQGWTSTTALVAPHLTAALVSLLTLAAVIAVLRGRSPPPTRSRAVPSSAARGSSSATLRTRSRTSPARDGAP